MFWIVGHWATDSVFVKEDQQPESSMKSQSDCEVWVQTHLVLGCEYSVIKVAPGVIKVETQDQARE